MRLVVDPNQRQSYARCVFTAPTVLRMYGKESVEYDYNPGSEGLDAATVLQPEPDASERSRKITVQETAKTARISEIFDRIVPTRKALT
jgi:hypothetical protein